MGSIVCPHPCNVSATVMDSETLEKTSTNDVAHIQSQVYALL
jgi:hypothetical protein